MWNLGQRHTIESLTCRCLFPDGDCSGGWKYRPESDTYYCYHTDMTKTYDQARSLCDTLYPGAYLVAIETEAEQIFLEYSPLVLPCKQIYDVYNMWYVY